MSDKMDNAIVEVAVFLDLLANKLDDRAQESRKFGWSTHQVNANITTASDCRREAAKLRNLLRSEIA